MYTLKFLNTLFQRNNQLEKEEIELKEWECVQVGHHKDVGKVIEEFQRNGWRLHTYQATGRDVMITHYLLFEKGE